jgi:hypothetical protein
LHHCKKYGILQSKGMFGSCFAARDTRRAGLPGGSRQMVKKELNVGEASERQLPATPGKPHKWSKPISILDTENNGYTV